MHHRRHGLETLLSQTRHVHPAPGPIDRRSPHQPPPSAVYRADRRRLVLGVCRLSAGVRAFGLEGRRIGRDRTRPEPARHDNGAPHPEPCRAVHEEHGQYDTARIWRRCCRPVQVSRDTPGTKWRVWAQEQVKPRAPATRQSPHPPPFPAPFTEPAADRGRRRREGPPALYRSGSPSTTRGIPRGFPSLSGSGNSHAGAFCHTTGLRKRWIAALPTDV